MSFKIYLLSSVLLVFPSKAWLSEVEGKTGGRGDRRHSSDINHLVTQGRERLFFCILFVFFLPPPPDFSLLSLILDNSLFS